MNSEQTQEENNVFQQRCTSKVLLSVETQNEIGIQNNHQTFKFD